MNETYIKADLSKIDAKMQRVFETYEAFKQALSDASLDDDCLQIVLAEKKPAHKGQAAEE